MRRGRGVECLPCYLEHFAKEMYSCLLNGFVSFAYFYCFEAIKTECFEALYSGFHNVF